MMKVHMKIITFLLVQSHLLFIVKITARIHSCLLTIRITSNWCFYLIAMQQIFVPWHSLKFKFKINQSLTSSHSIVGVQTWPSKTGVSWSNINRYSERGSHLSTGLLLYLIFLLISTCVQVDTTPFPVVCLWTCVCLILVVLFFLAVLLSNLNLHLSYEWFWTHSCNNKFSV